MKASAVFTVVVLALLTPAAHAVNFVTSNFEKGTFIDGLLAAKDASGEAMLHFGEAMKAIINEEFGDGIMSAIDFFTTLQLITGSTGEARVLIQLNGKYLPHVEQIASNNTAPM